MENLNDVEFGSDKSTEEAPILVAQRYLNIYRQVHIFNKAKRDQFDDELLALPPTITDFFKRMPGGRLLVEHIEEVKTERGIAFIKSNKEDFAEGSGTSSTPAPQSGAVVPVGVGGSVTVDASFAEALAQSMATAFSQNPIQTNVSGNFTPSGTIDFGNAFDVIAEEIKTSRACVLDILKETKSMTDSVIASQVSISRILEGILSSKTKGDIGAADLNNRIIASQTSITKLLEGLYNTGNATKGDVSAYLNIDRKLQDFKAEIKKEVETTILNTIKNFDVNKVSLVNVLPSSPNDILDTEDYSDIKEDNTPLETTNFNTDEISQKKKKKKKKKNKNPQAENTNNSEVLASVSAPIVGGVIHNKLFKHEDDFKNINLDEPPMEFDEDISLDMDVNEAPEISSLASLDSNFTIKDIENETSQDIDDGLSFELPKQSFVEKNTDDSNESFDESSLPEELDDGLSFALPEQGALLKHKLENTEQIQKVDNNLEEFDLIKQFPEDDGLSFDLPEKDMDLDDISVDDTDLDGNFSKDYDEIPVIDTDKSSLANNINLEDIFNENDKMSFEENIYEPNEDNNQSVQDFDFESMNTIENISLEDFSQTNSSEDEALEINNENDFNYSNDDDLDIKDNDNSFEQFDEMTKEENLVEENNDLELDNFFANNMTENSTITEEENNNIPSDNIFEENNIAPESTESTDIDSFLSFNEDSTDKQIIEDDTITEVDLADDITTKETITSTEQPQSRYSAELDKIRAALTSENVDLSTLDEPIALDDYSDDENISDDYDDITSNTDDDQEWEYEYVEDNETSGLTEFVSEETSSTTQSENQEDWEWEYVDENGNPIEGDENSEDWEWEYVEEEEENNQDNNQ